MKTPSFNDHPLPEDDRDLRLARHVGQELDESGLRLIDPDVATDPLLMLLESERDSLVPPHVVPASQKAAGWNALAPSLTMPTRQPARPAQKPKRTPSRSTSTTFHFLTPSFKYAFAAVIIVLIGVVAVANLQRSDAPDLPVLAAALQTSSVFEAPDGSVVTLRPNSTLYDATPDASTATSPVNFVLVGEAFFDIAHDPGRTVTVEAGKGRVQVLGTRFNLSTWGRQTALFLQSGRVSFTAPSAKAPVNVEPGQAVVLAADGQLGAPQATSGTEAIDWMQDELAFESTRVALVVAELEHHFNLELNLPARLTSELITGRLLLNNKTRTLAELGSLLGGTFRETAPQEYQFE